MKIKIKKHEHISKGREMNMSNIEPLFGLVRFDFIFPSSVFVIILFFVTNGNTTFVGMSFSSVSKTLGNIFAKFAV